MQEQKTLLALGDIIQNRYMIEDVLGTGGFSTVYLVRSLQVLGEQGNEKKALFALKKLNYASHQEKVRFALEGEILKKLNHPALPHFYRIFEDHDHVQDFMLLEYIAGPNLEVLRQQQQHKRFSLPEVLTIMQPIVEAVAYLHNQKPPIMHRDIKPANIIVPDSRKGAVLVDFGIAKEYESDATTTAIRHFSPGYGAPEQYSNYGTDPRTDIYGLGATCYTLLTGTIPADAFIRTTTLVSKKTDALVSINNIVTTVPAHVTHAIERAMSIGQESRFPTVEAFWLALNTSSVKETSLLPVLSTLSSPTASRETLHHETYQHIQKQTRKLHGTNLSAVLLALFISFLLLIGGGLGFWAYIQHNHSGVSLSANHKPSLHKPIFMIPATSESNYSPSIKSHYIGTIHDLLTANSTAMSLTNISQHNERINGSFTGLHLSSTFTGVLDSSQHIFFTVHGNTSHSPIFFEGAVRSDGNLAGNYCNVDPTGQCIGNYGLWSIAPI